MSEEEKKAIAYLKFYIERDVMYEDTHYEQIKTILNLIEKQQKEIEELKNTDLTTVYLNGFYDGEKKVNDKIKAILEEYKYTEIGDSEKIIKFYEKMQSLLEKE